MVCTSLVRMCSLTEYEVGQIYRNVVRRCFILRLPEPHAHGAQVLWWIIRTCWMRSFVAKVSELPEISRPIFNLSINLMYTKKLSCSLSSASLFIMDAAIGA